MQKQRYKHKDAGQTVHKHLGWILHIPNIAEGLMSRARHRLRATFKDASDLPETEHMVKKIGNDILVDTDFKNILT